VIAAAAAVLGLLGEAAANPYEAFVDVESEDDLYDLLASQQITQETFDTLFDLLQRGVDLNTASRDELYSLPNLTYDDVDAILLYRAEQRYIRDPADLVGAGVITDDKLLAIAAFLVLRDPTADRFAARGWVHAMSGVTVGDDLAPPAGLRGRVQVGRHLTAGLATAMTRLRVGDAVYDPNRRALVVDDAALRGHLAKLYVHYETDHVAAIVGTYRIGFGQRLTFDNTGAYTPDGITRDDQLYRVDGLARRCRQTTGELEASPCADDYRYVTGDVSWREALTGVAIGIRKLAVGDAKLSAHGWVSYQPRSIYQYELYDAARCDDPRADDDPACAAPEVFVRPAGSPLTPAAELSYATLPAMYAEGVVGGNATLALGRRSYVGATAYGATVDWLVDSFQALDLDFQEWASRPSGGAFGAAGVTAGIGVSRFDLALEAAHSFDSMQDGGGGPAALVRATWTEPRVRELEASLRFYDTAFVNPYGRPIAASDEYEGQRARDEVGGRLRYLGRHGKLAVRAGLDAWQQLTEGLWKGEAYLRADVTASKKLAYGLWLEVNDRDLAAGGRGQCYEQAFEFDELGEPVPCGGMRVSTTGRARVEVRRDLSLSAQAQHELLDDQDYPEGFRQDVSAWLSALWKPRKHLALRGRVRYLSEDVADPESLEESLWFYGDLTTRLRHRDRLRLRLDTYVWLDDRERTAERQPSPELRLWAQYEARF
jgi:hypothetical protein